MGKKEKAGSGNLGKALIRNRFGSTKRKKHDDMTMIHTMSLNDGYDWGRLNLQSVTEESSFQEFLSTAELAGTEFQAEKLNIKFVNPKSGIGLLSKDEKEKILETQQKNKALLKIPRRPQWDSSTTAQELQAKEREHFLEWRRTLSLLQEAEGLMLTPYEKNLEFWRQLWRVVERSDVIVQIVDARNPLLFRCEDLESYVKEVNPEKMNTILVNKADFLTEQQRKEWAKYFSDINVRVAFFSATLAAERQKVQETIQEENSESEEGSEVETDTEDEDDDESLYNSGASSESIYESADDNMGIIDDSECINKNSEVENGEHIEPKDNKCDLHALKTSIEEVSQDNARIENSSELLTRDQLVSFFKRIYKGKTCTEGITTIGLVGYPNVGKSSTINALLMDKKVSVSATPGKTKHFQTLFLDTDLLLCDCPGLVMPSFICTKAEMILNGILPIDQMRDHVPPITLLGTLIPRHIMEDLYGIMLPLPIEGEDPDRPPTAEEMLNAYGYNRGFMTQNGQPDNPRSARYVLKDFVNGKLLYCVAPPTVEQEKFHIFPPQRRTIPVNKHLPARTIRASKGSKTSSEDVDKVFFQSNVSSVHTKGMIGKMRGTCRIGSSDTGSVVNSTQSLLLEEKPWKKINKHSNKKKREKTRRLYAHLDQH
ncbi:PREDICTED: large subunit GTPase 1 homolog [Dufourea novaeangliae]|uniref:Large subunit GTPase 1 homolog n=1 Tax=Dufourea novaeangliae TaxID=178035 RepID=A0A154P928_DUFNO|nr:PREDICTED: large subunit GTPase 1 homolog [Dufourea novaeangliae]KZC07728.1 Large subunit GTPase 1 like protein [Dufourea novaeangliae]